MSGVSIVIPSYNRPDMLAESLVSLKIRTRYEPIEIIVSDGGSERHLLAKYDIIKSNGYFDKLALMPYKEQSSIKIGDHASCISNTLMTGLEASNPDYPYVFFGADDLIYRTGWVDVLIEMLESDWAVRNNVKIVSGFNHWALPGDYGTMKGCVPELYKSADGKVRGYCAIWGGNWFMRKKDFYDMGGFKNNIKYELADYLKDNYEMIFQYRFKENGWNWGTTMDTYVQTVALPNSSSLGNYRLDEAGNRITSEQYKNGIAVGVSWKDE